MLLATPATSSNALPKCKIIKSAREQLNKADQCFDLGDGAAILANDLHDSAAKQLDMAAKQQSIGSRAGI